MSAEQDGQPVSIFILKTTPHGMKAAEVFLRNRNWIVASSNNMRDAFAYVVQKQPSFVLIAADHPNKKVKTLPKLLVQAFPVRVLGFAESQNGAAVAALHEMGLEYSLFPPVSGPAIERMILKIRKDEEKKANAKANTKLTPSVESGFTVSGGEPTISEEDFRKSFEQARAALQQMVSSEPEGNSEVQGSASIISGAGSGSTSSSGAAPMSAAGQAASQQPGAQRGSGVIIQKGTPGSAAAGGPAYTPSHMGKEADEEQETTSMIFMPEPGWVPASDKKPDDKNNGDQAQNNGSSSATWMPSGNGSQEKSSQDPSHSPNGAQFPLSGREQSGGPAWMPTEGGGKSNSATGESADSSSSSVDTKKKQAPVFESDPLSAKNKEAPTFESETNKDSQSPLSLFAKGTQKALDESVQAKSGQTVQSLGATTNVACITINSTRFSGYLVAALGKDKKIDQDFIELIRKRLINFLKAHGESIQDNEKSLHLKIETVEFEDWAIEKAEFLRKSVHGNDEVAMAFFPTKENKPKLEDSESGKMVQINLQDLREDVPVEFDLYIYLPENNKYLLYTPQGRNFMNSQKARLKEKGITHMHLRKDSETDAKRYQAQNFLNDKIGEFKKGLPSKK